MIRCLDRLVEAAAALCFAASTILICANVFYRYVVLDWLRNGAKSWDWLAPVYQALDEVFGALSITADEVPGLLLVWIAFLGAYQAMRGEGHISFDLLVEKAPAGIRLGLRSGIHFLMLAFLVLLLWQSVRLIRVSGAREIETAEIAQGWFMLILPIAAVLLGLALIVRIRDDWRPGKE